MSEYNVLVSRVCQNREYQLKILCQLSQYCLPGKMLSSDFDGKVEFMDRIVTTVTSPSLTRDQTLGFSSLEVASGYNTAR